MCLLWLPLLFVYLQWQPSSSTVHYYVVTLYFHTILCTDCFTYLPQCDSGHGDSKSLGHRVTSSTSFSKSTTCGSQGTRNSKVIIYYILCFCCIFCLPPKWLYKFYFRGSFNFKNCTIMCTSRVWDKFHLQVLLLNPNMHLTHIKISEYIGYIELYKVSETI